MRMSFNTTHGHHNSVIVLRHSPESYVSLHREYTYGSFMSEKAVAAFQAGPLMATYYASKAYVLHFSEALNEELEGSEVSVTALCPGPVMTEFQQVADMETSGLVHNKALMSVEAVIESGYEAMMRGKSLVIPGLGMKMGAFFVRFAPRRLSAKFIRRLQEEREP